MMTNIKHNRKHSGRPMSCSNSWGMFIGGEFNVPNQMSNIEI